MKQVYLAIIGAGYMGSLYARICSQMPGVNVVTLCDARAERVEPLAAELGSVAYAGEEYRQMLQEHPRVDGVIICTPEDSHVDPALAVLEAGRHILVEKPLALTVEDAEDIVEAARKKDVITMMAYDLRFDPRYVARSGRTAMGRSERSSKSILDATPLRSNGLEVELSCLSGLECMISM